MGIGALNKVGSLCPTTWLLIVSQHLLIISPMDLSYCFYSLTHTYYTSVNFWTAICFIDQSIGWHKTILIVGFCYDLLDHMFQNFFTFITEQYYSDILTLIKVVSNYTKWSCLDFNWNCYIFRIIGEKKPI